MNAVSSENSEVDFTTLSITEQRVHIMSWFAGTEFPIEKPEDITDIKMVGDYNISFWYEDKLCNCPTGKKFNTDYVVISETENYSVSILKLRILNRAQQYLNPMTTTKEGGLIGV